MNARMIAHMTALALAALLFAQGGAQAQGIFDLFGPDRPERAPRAARKVPRAAEEPRASAKAKKPGAPKSAARTESGKTARTPAKAEPQSADAPPPPYEGQLMRLSEVLGALAFLRDLCNAPDRDDWRGQMAALLNAEAPEGARREKFVGAFNRGFHGYEMTYRACTPNAKTAAVRYLDEAAKISKDVAYRFGNP